jgi:putative redox protein
MRFGAMGEEGVTLSLDASRMYGGSSAAFRPLELLLISLGSCTAMDVISILRKKRQDVTSYRVEVEAVQSPIHPKVYTDIAIRHIIRGNELSDEAVRRSIELSETKYCPAYAMLRHAARISSSYEILAASPSD